MRRQVFDQPAPSPEAAKRRSAHPVTSGHIWTGAEQLAWIKDGDVFSAATQQKIATLDDEGNLYSLDGHSLDLHLETVNGGGRIGAGSHRHAIAKFKALADGS
jgi:hypothetical protein